MKKYFENFKDFVKDYPEVFIFSIVLVLIAIGGTIAIIWAVNCGGSSLEGSSSGASMSIANPANPISPLNPANPINHMH